MGIREGSWIKFPIQKWISEYHFTPNKPYKVEGTNGGAVFLINDDGVTAAVGVKHVIKCTKEEAKLARILLE